MRIIPSEISSSTKSQAEHSVFAALKAIPDDQSVALHTVHLPKHHRKRVGEIDFVVIMPDILLFIEVKGGRVHHSDGKWYYGPPGREEGPKESPFAQASGGMHEFEREIGALVGGLRDQGVPSGYLVITTDVDIRRTTEFEPQQYLGATAYDGGRGLAQGIERATRFWLARNRWARTPVSASLRKKMLEAIRPDFDLVPNLQSRLTHLDVAFERLTNEQFDRLDELESNPRLIWTGGAGTGKTFLAAEAARRKSAHGSVLFTCASTTLATHVSRILTDGAITVLPYDRLDEVRDRVFDQLIVDEAQDLMTFESLDVFEALVSGGLAEGRWIFMLDQNNQVLTPDAYDPDAWEYLRPLGSVYGPMKRNCRNTVQIVKQVHFYTGADLGVASAGEGEPVRYVDVHTAQEEATVLDTYVNELVGEGVSPRDITLLSASGDWETSSVRLSQRASRIERFADVVGTDRTKHRLTWSSVSDFKGHENHVVCLIDLEPEHLEGRLDALYVAWTRARAQLWVACRPGTRRKLKDLGMAALTGEGRLK
ncbi:NERD domain-containing protein [Streptomyces griseiscabiei]|uniref:NERD domain-containing protein n=1 Tax=Streptomyces griseiscabiei TaxID=2993540 RepID=A0ABU4KZC6_9ACTN|nr:NERD domain-containing protein [Streptomyces griseiscabiei]MBZ3901029.1 NERD domain-containing protein [Streptomyces griseiscabiei]MDX2908840.1 NERD domain-containing protein [Streptomyces griseiscabiei]